MAFKIRAAGEYGVGYAWLEIDAAVRPDVTFYLSCPNRLQQIYLSDGKPQGQPYAWRPRAIEGTSSGSGTRLLIGPEIVDHMWNDELVRIEVPAIDYRAEASWEDIPVSTVRQTKVEKDGEDIDRPAPEKEQSAPPGSTSPETTVPDSTGPIGVPPGGSSSGEASGGVESGSAAGNSTAFSQPRWLIAAAALGACLGMFIGYEYVTATPAYAASGLTPVPAGTVEEAERLLASGERASERLYLLGTEIYGAPAAPREVGLEAIRHAAEMGSGQAYLWLGRASDPLRQDWTKARLKPDAPRALEDYVRAGDAGNTERNALCSHLKTQPTMTDAERDAIRAHCP